MNSKGSWVALATCSAESPIASNRCAISVLASCLPSALPFSIPFFHTFFHSFLIPVIQKGSFNTYRIPEFIIGTEFGISKAGNFKIFYGFSNLRVIEQVGWNILRIGIDFREETEPQYHHALVGNGMRSELREFYEGEMQALDDLIAVLIVHDAVVVDEIRSIMRKDIIYQVERIYWLQFAVFASLFA